VCEFRFRYFGRRHGHFRPHVSPENTVNTIQGILRKYGASKILLEYENVQVSSVSFIYPHGDTELPFRLPFLRWVEAQYEVQADQGFKMLGSGKP